MSIRLVRRERSRWSFLDLPSRFKICLSSVRSFPSEFVRSHRMSQRSVLHLARVVSSHNSDLSGVREHVVISTFCLESLALSVQHALAFFLLSEGDSPRISYNHRRSCSCKRVSSSFLFGWRCFLTNTYVVVDQAFRERVQQFQHGIARCHRLADTNSLLRGI